MVRSKPFSFLLFWHIKVIHCDIFSSHLGIFNIWKIAFCATSTFFFNLFKYATHSYLQYSVNHIYIVLEKYRVYSTLYMGIHEGFLRFIIKCWLQNQNLWIAKNAFLCYIDRIGSFSTTKSWLDEIQIEQKYAIEIKMKTKILCRKTKVRFIDVD